MLLAYVRINLFMCIIGPQWMFQYPDYCVNSPKCSGDLGG
jgi:hypothetical protein